MCFGTKVSISHNCTTEETCKQTEELKVQSDIDRLKFAPRPLFCSRRNPIKITPLPILTNMH